MLVSLAWSASHELRINATFVQVSNVRILSQQPVRSAERIAVHIGSASEHCRPTTIK